MLIEQTLASLHALKLPGMASALDEQRAIPDLAALSFEERLALLLEREHAVRHDRRLTRLLQLARLRYAACIEDVNFRAKRGLDRHRVLQLAGGDWIRQHQTPLIVGPTGVGKTHLSVGLGRAAITAGYTVLFTSATTLIAQLMKAHTQGCLDEKLLHFSKPKLLIIDELGYLPIEPDAAHVLFQLVSRRYERGSILLTSNRAVSEWGTSSAIPSSRPPSSTVSCTTVTSSPSGARATGSKRSDAPDS